jgi:signal transduction histidine kinase
MKNINFELEFDAREKNFFKRLLGDERRYLQILINFLSNAIKFSHEKSRIVVGLRINALQIKSQERSNQTGSAQEIIITTSPEQTLYISFDLIVQDFGCGMSKESVSKLFIDFNTIEENASLNRNGVGLGLSICK